MAFCSVFVVSKSPCEKLISKGSLSLGSSASLPPQSGNRDGLPALNTKILFSSECPLQAGCVCLWAGAGGVLTCQLARSRPFALPGTESGGMNETRSLSYETRALSFKSLYIGLWEIEIGFQSSVMACTVPLFIIKDSQHSNRCQRPWEDVIKGVILELGPQG